MRMRFIPLTASAALAVSCGGSGSHTRGTPEGSTLGWTDALVCDGFMVADAPDLDWGTGHFGLVVAVKSSNRAVMTVFQSPNL